MEEREVRSRDEYLHHARLLGYDCDHILHNWRTPAIFGDWIQHGDNPEARLFISYTDMITGIAPRLLAEWIARIHSYEETLEAASTSDGD